jgi:hypothetical protein
MERLFGILASNPLLVDQVVIALLRGHISAIRLHLRMWRRPPSGQMQYVLDRLKRLTAST